MEKNKSWRPRRLADISLSPDPWNDLRDFCHQFYASPRADMAAMLSDEPELSGDQRLDAYLGAVAEYFSQYAGAAAPAWSQKEARFLSSPWFDTKIRSLKGWMARTTPEAFRKRMIFTGEEPLFRPAKLGMGS